MSMTQAERITALETQMNFLVAEQREINQKLAELLALRNKGAGAFWLATTLFGTSLIGVLAMITSWVRG